MKHYEFLLQISNFSDVNLHKKYYFIVWLLPYLKIGSYGAGFDLKEKIEITDFYQKKGKEEKRENLKSNPIVKMPTIKDFGMNEDDEMRLSEIIEEINNLTGMHYDNDVAFKAALQIRDLMKKNENLVASAKTNTIQGFEDSFYNEADEALLDGLSQNQEFFTMLLNEEKIKKEKIYITPEYLFALLSNKWTGYFQAIRNTVIAATIPHLRENRLENFEIPILEKDIIDKITKIVKKSFELKNESKKLDKEMTEILNT